MKIDLNFCCTEIFVKVLNENLDANKNLVLRQFVLTFIMLYLMIFKHDFFVFSASGNYYLNTKSEPRFGKGIEGAYSEDN